ncbi:MAG: hypothetical protein GVY36_05200 [Verrucomicrobia bacterium]|nr:hypothetical protein [Verrucomicrobiota bacterium]
MKWWWVAGALMGALIVGFLGGRLLAPDGSDSVSTGGRIAEAAPGRSNEAGVASNRSGARRKARGNRPAGCVAGYGTAREVVGDCVRLSSTCPP